MTFEEMRDRIANGQGFIAALDQSGGSTPKALRGYGVEDNEWNGDDEMFGMIHEMRQRIIEAPCFGNGKVIGAILFEKTMEGESGGKSVPARLAERGIVPFLKVDKGLEEERDGVQLMKPNPGLEAMCARAKELGVFGTKMRSVIKSANPKGIRENVRQQFADGVRILTSGLVPILEPEYDITAADRAEGEKILLDELIAGLDTLHDDQQVIFKLSIPKEAGLYSDLIKHPKVLRVVALSGGYSTDEACSELAKNPGMIASFSRGLLQDLRKQQDDGEFDGTLSGAIDQIHAASVS
ncbi:fructose bisphosphate aldolase [Qipengyuania aquimaris]|uniref:fructose-bisphosphate aldolase n=1 Tax=Qipengyuania aquimaris TaxID=255984 RepID=A0A9Q3XBQ9_9SPHN|nr:fructose bisphosphate aldolase [Qipengyuania aquimaris]MBY6217403.1 fructose bisphosphate aldolase [Qipengyuania aquimaris]UOR14532.1 fructose bisphosphate aldolase [Qipengyuania aquimaris]